MTFDKQSNARQTAVEWNSHRSCHHRMNVIEHCWVLVWVMMMMMTMMMIM